MLRRKGPKRLLIAPLTSVPIGKLFEMITIDVCDPLPVTNRGILVAADDFSKLPKCWAIPDQEAKTITRCLEELIGCHGVP